MNIGAGLSLDPAAAAAAAAREAGLPLAPLPASFAMVVVSRAHGHAADAVLKEVRDVARPEQLISCVAETVVGSGREVEAGPGVVNLPRHGCHRAAAARSG